jgi:hypothetical protein
MTQIIKNSEQQSAGSILYDFFYCEIPEIADLPYLPY